MSLRSLSRRAHKEAWKQRKYKRVATKRVERAMQDKQLEGRNPALVSKVLDSVDLPRIFRKSQGKLRSD